MHHCQHQDKTINNEKLLITKKTLTVTCGYQDNHAIGPQEGSIACLTVDRELFPSGN